MTATKPGFTVIGEEPAPPPPNAQATMTAINTQMLMLGLRALSQRTLTAITNLFTLGLVASAWWLWSAVLPNPSWMQLVGLGGYAAFVLSIEFLRRSR